MMGIVALIVSYINDMLFDLENIPSVMVINDCNFW